jgi:hypothetical protein
MISIDPASLGLLAVVLYELNQVKKLLTKQQNETEQLWRGHSGSPALHAALAKGPQDGTDKTQHH